MNIKEIEEQFKKEVEETVSKLLKVAKEESVNPAVLGAACEVISNGVMEYAKAIVEKVTGDRDANPEEALKKLLEDSEDNLTPSSIH